jgi:hypothetical protein
MWSVVRVNVFIPVVARWVRKLHICYSNCTQRVVLISFLISWLLISSRTVYTGMVMWGCSLEKTQTLAWCLDLVLWHYHWTWWIHCQGDFGQKKGNNKIGLFTIFPKCGSIWLLALNRTEDCFDKTRDFLIFLTFRDIWPSWRVLQKSNILNSEKTDSLSVLLWKETTLMVIGTISVVVLSI